MPVMTALTNSQTRRRRRGIAVAAATLALSGLVSVASAQPSSEEVELAVNGPEGALLFVDGQAMGRLPLPVNLTLRSGPHRFRLEQGNKKAESDTLTLPANRQSELNLTLAGRNLVAVLRVTPGLLMVLSPATIPAEQRAQITESVATAARQEHAVLLGLGRQAGTVSRSAALSRCIESADCHEAPPGDEQASYVLSIRIENGPTGPRIRAALLDVRTRDLGAQGEEECGSCNAAQLAAKAQSLTARLIRETAARPRGSLSVSSTPADARVLIDGRWLGRTPFQQEVFTGSRAIEVQRDRFLSHKEDRQIEPGQSVDVQVALQPVPQAPQGPKSPVAMSRPKWRIITGSLALGAGLVLAGFGTSALLADGQCKDSQASAETCSPFYNTKVVGGALVGTGAALAVGGTILLAIP